MAEQSSSALAMWTEGFSAEHLEAVARQTGFVQRTSKMTGTSFLALITFGVWSDAKTTLAPLAAQVPQWRQPVAVSPEAIDQRMNKRALAFLQELRRQAFATLQSCPEVSEDALLTPFANVHMAASTGVALPASLHKTFPGSGGSAAPAGATLHLVWDDTSSGVHPLARTPWNLPDQNDIATVVTFARHDDLCLVDWGSFTSNAWARIADAKADFWCRLNQQTTLLAVVADRTAAVALAPFLATIERPLVQQPIVSGTTERLTSRRIASRVPEAIVNARRRSARQHAQNRGYPPSQAHVALLAWHLFSTHVPPTLWQPPTVLRVDPLRGPVELLVKSWKSPLHGATITTTKEDPTWCYVSGRMRLMLRNDALCPQLRATRWMKRPRALSFQKLVRHFQALSAPWMHALVQSESELRRCLQHACATAERLVLKASRTRCTTAQTLRDCLHKPHEAVAVMEAVNA